MLPIESEVDHRGLAVAAIRGRAHRSQITGKETEAKSLMQEFAKEQKQLNEAFWSPDGKFFAFAMDRDNKRVDEPTVLTTVPMWFGLTDEAKSQQTIAELAKPEHETDWGMRIISNRAPKYSGGGYHYGSVWPLFTGWASVAEYRYHMAQPGYDNLRANALLALDGSPGHVTEVLSGDYYQPLSTSSPHQIWSAAMVISPMLRGLLGLESIAASHKVVFAPHVPADWTSFAVRNIRTGDATLDLRYGKTQDEIKLDIESTGDSELDFSPALSLRAQVVGAEINGHRVPVQIQRNDFDEHPLLRASLIKGKNTIRIIVNNDFGISYSNELPQLGSASE